MKVLHIQYRMPPAGNACYRLHTAMKENGIDSSGLTIVPSVKRNDVYSLKQNTFSLFLKIYNYIYSCLLQKKLRPGSYFYSHLPAFGHSLHKYKLVKDADVIYFHWVAGGCLKLKEVDKIAATGKLIVFFMHDMWDFTGGCHHSFDCRGYETGCAECKMFVKKCSLSSKQIEAKRKLFSRYSNIIFVAPSNWMTKCARNSFALENKKIYTISNVVDETVFKPIDKYTARIILNLPTEKKIITFGCQAGTANKYKGWDYLSKAIELLDVENVHIVVYGSDYDKKTQEQLKYPVTFLGPILDETKLSLICNATDVFVSPSLAESFGLTFLENELCNTPVVGFDNTAIGEVVKTDISGYLAKNKNSEDLAKGIEILLENDLKIDIRNTYSSKNIVKEHLNIIHSFCKQ